MGELTVHKILFCIIFSIESDGGLAFYGEESESPRCDTCVTHPFEAAL